MSKEVVELELYKDQYYTYLSIRDWTSHNYSLNPARTMLGNTDVSLWDLVLNYLITIQW